MWVYAGPRIGGVMSKNTNKHTTQAARELERGFAVDLMQHLVVPTFVLGADCRVIIWNRACERLTGVSMATVVGTRDHWQAFYDHPRPCLADLIAQGRTDEVGALYADFDRSSGSANGFHAQNWCRMPKVGTRLYLAVDAGPIFDEDGHLLAVVETLRDMTVQKEAQSALELLASKDPLTGLANRRAFDEGLMQEWRRALRCAQPLSLVMFDVDHFKRYNDTYGHQQGDACLRSMALALGGATKRAGDLVARYGGEEFVLVLPGTSAAGAAIVAERVRATVQDLALPHAGSSAASVVTVSVGVASCIPDESLSADALVAAADRALYCAKRAGRNRVEQSILTA